MRPNKCCFCELRTGSLILLGICFYIAVREVGRDLKHKSDEDLIYATIDCIFLVFGFLIVSKVIKTSINIHSMCGVPFN